MRIALITFVVVAALGLAFVFFVPRGSEALPPAPATTTTPTLYVSDSYSKGTHTIKGAFSVPTPCTSVSAEATVIAGIASTSPDTIAIAVSAPPDTGICVQMVATSTFSVSATAGKGAVITASVNGVVAHVVE